MHDLKPTTDDTSWLNGDESIRVSVGRGVDRRTFRARSLTWPPPKKPLHRPGKSLDNFQGLHFAWGSAEISALILTGKWPSKSIGGFGLLSALLYQGLAECKLGGLSDRTKKWEKHTFPVSAKTRIFVFIVIVVFIIFISFELTLIVVFALIDLSHNTTFSFRANIGWA